MLDTSMGSLIWAGYKNAFKENEEYKNKYGTPNKRKKTSSEEEKKDVQVN